MNKYPFIGLPSNVEFSPFCENSNNIETPKYFVLNGQPQDYLDKGIPSHKNRLKSGKKLSNFTIVDKSDLSQSSELENLKEQRGRKKPLASQKQDRTEEDIDIDIDIDKGRGRHQKKESFSQDSNEWELKISELLDQGEYFLNEIRDIEEDLFCPSIRKDDTSHEDNLDLSTIRKNSFLLMNRVRDFDNSFFLSNITGNIRININEMDYRDIDSFVLEKVFPVEINKCCAFDRKKFLSLIKKKISKEMKTRFFKSLVSISLLFNPSFSYLNWRKRVITELHDAYQKIKNEIFSETSPVNEDESLNLIDNYVNYVALKKAKVYVKKMISRVLFIIPTKKMSNNKSTMFVSRFVLSHFLEKQVEYFLSLLKKGNITSPPTRFMTYSDWSSINLTRISQVQLSGMADAKKMLDLCADEIGEKTLLFCNREFRKLETIEKDQLIRFIGSMIETLVSGSLLDVAAYRFYEELKLSMDPKSK